jgi:hypothetical protein
MQASHAYRPAAVGEAVRFASRQVWLASLGAAVVTRDWANKEAGKAFGTLVRQGAVVESRAIRFVGTRIEGSVARASALVGQARTTLRGAVKDYADGAATLVRETLPRIPMPAALRPAAPVRRTAKRAQKRAKPAVAVKRARKAKRAKAAKRA